MGLVSPLPLLASQGLVDRTRAHPKYAKNYRLETDAAWITAPACGEACAGLPQVVALDCEMCASEVRPAFLVPAVCLCDRGCGVWC